jgi:hypothetical protein
VTEPIALPLRVRPFGARLAAGLAAAALVAAMAFLWVMLPDEVQEDFSVSQRVTLVGFLVAVLAALNAIFRTSAKADVDALTVTNGYRTRRFEWAEIVRISLSPNRPWALIDLAAGDTASVMAIQVSDGDRAKTATRQLKAVLAQQSATDRDD